MKTPSAVPRACWGAAREAMLGWQDPLSSLQDNARLLGDLSRAQGDLHQAQEEMRGLRPLKDELGFAQRRSEELGRRLVEQDAAVQQLSTSKEQLQAKVDELLFEGPKWKHFCNGRKNKQSGHQKPEGRNDFRLIHD